VRDLPRRTAAATVDTPVGGIMVVAGPDGLTSLGFDTTPRDGVPWDPDALAPLSRRILGYFEDPTSLGELPVAAPVGAFAASLRAALAQVPVGATTSYGELARRVGRPGAARAVGRAMATNPVALVVPCHRVVRGDGGLGGYAWGLDRKRALLEHEDRHRGGPE